MLATTLAGLMFLLPVALYAGDKIPPLKIKTGLWETTMTTTTRGEMPLPAEVLSKMTPEQRAKIEQRLKASAGEKTRTLTDKNCVTKEKLEEGLAFGREADKQCTHTVLTSTDSRIDVRVACAGEGMNSGGTLHFEALSPVSVKGSAHMSVTGGGRDMKIDINYSSKWIGAVCGKSE